MADEKEKFDELNEDLEKQYDEILGKSTEEESSPKRRKEDDAYAQEDEDEVEEKEAEQPEEPADEDKEVEEKETKEGEEEEEEIPFELVEAGRAAGFTDEKIVELAENSPEVLTALYEFRQQALQAQQTSAPEETPAEKPQEEEGEQKVTIDPKMLEKMDEGTRTVVLQLIQNQNRLVEQLNSFQQRHQTLEQMQQEEFDASIDGFFDSVVENCPDVGLSNEMTPENEAVRQEIYQIACVLYNAEGGSLEQCLEKAVKAYNGIYGRTEDVLRRKLNKQKKRFSPRPGGQKTKPKFKSEDEKVMSIIDTKLREYGI